jgi:choline dehydrogenase
MPYVTNGNIYAPVMMLAEKSADIVLDNTPLPPLHAPYYRHRDGSPLNPPAEATDTRLYSGGAT